MEKIKKTHLQSEIIEAINKYIKVNKLKPGDKMPSQQQMADALGVSRVSIREAMKSLEARNVISIVNGKGVYYKGGKIQKENEKFNETELIIDLLQVRLAIEQEIIKLVVELASDEEIEEIGKVAEIIMEKYNQGCNDIKEDRLFHDLLYKACHNKLLTGMIRFLGKTYEIFWQNPMGLGDFLTETIPNHMKLYQYIKARDAKRAQAVNERMLRSIIRYVRNKYQK
jgi:GntR family transcriptional repressor for pyruvate dehydrogenase complex